MKKIIFKGMVVKNLPNVTFLIKFEEIDNPIICYLSGKMRINFIKILPGDIVKVEFSCFDYSKGRIIYRIK